MYSLNRGLADLAREKRWDTLPQVHEDLKALTEILSWRFLADNYRKQAPKDSLKVDDKDVFEYYRQNLTAYTLPGYASYVKVFLPPSEAAEKKAREMLMPYQKTLPKEPDQIKKAEDGGVLLTFDYQMPLQQGYPYFEELRSARQGEILGPFSDRNLKIMLLVTDIQYPKPIPFEEVKPLCRQNLIQQKIAERQIQTEKEALRKYPVIVLPELLQRN